MANAKQLLNGCKRNICILLIGVVIFSCKDDIILNNPLDPQVPLATPSDLRIVSMAEYYVKLQWQNTIKETSPEVGKNIFTIIEQSINGNPFIVTDTITFTNEAIINDTIIPNITYRFRIRYLAGSRISAYSKIIFGSVSTFAPSNLVSTILSETRCKLIWKDNSLSETGFRIQRKIRFNGIYSTVGQLPADTTSFVDSTILITDTVYYQVCALYNSGNTSNYCSVIVFTSFTPANLNAIINTEMTRRLSWQDRSFSEIGFRIERAIGSNGTFEMINQVPANTTLFDDSTLILNDSVFYKVCAVYIDRISDYCSLDIINSYSPSNFEAISVDETARKLTWQDNSNYEIGFHIERKMGPSGTFLSIGQVPANTTNYIDTAVIFTDTTYEYRIYADYGNGNITKYCTLDVALAFPGPGNIRTNTLSSTSLQILWDDNSTIESGFLIERRESGGEFIPVNSTLHNATSWTDIGLDSTKAYQYQISAFTSHNRSNYAVTPVIQYKIPSIFELGARWESGNFDVFQPSPSGNALLMAGDMPGFAANFIYNKWDEGTKYGNTHGTKLSCAAISRDNNYIATAADDTSLIIWLTGWNWNTNFKIPLTNHVLKVVFSNDGQRVFGACDDRKIRCWNTTNGSLYFTTLALSDSIIALDITSDGTYLVSASGRSVNLWNPSTGALSYTFPDVSNNIGLLKCSLNRIGISGYNEIHVFDILTKSVCFSSTGYANYTNPFTFNSDGSLLFIGDNTSVEIWRISDTKLIQKQNINTPITLIQEEDGQTKVFTIDKSVDPNITFYQYFTQYTWTP